MLYGWSLLEIRLKDHLKANILFNSFK